MSTPHNAEKQLAEWLSHEPEEPYRVELADLAEGIRSGDAQARHSAELLFSHRLKFGTAGIRGPMRPGPAGMNRVVVTQTTAGLARYLIERSTEGGATPITVVVGYDGRKHSAQFAQDTVEVLSGHGLRALLLPKLLPTPVLAFAVRRLAADAGIMITASHNPADDNGYKVYLGGEDEGSQIVPPVDGEIEKHIQAVSSSVNFSDIPRSTDHFEVVDDTIVGDYIRATVSSLNLPPVESPAVSVVYTAMHGVGAETFLKATEAARLPRPHLVEKQCEPDGSFPTVSFPNPEEKGALDLAFAEARSVGADLIIAHDPDADRLAVAVATPHGDSRYQTLTGNQVGAILGWYVAHRATSSGQLGALANSLVSSPVLGKIAQHFGLQHQETLTGFKYVSRVSNLIFGFEEALGYLVTPDVVRDKDGISAGLLMMSLANSLRAGGQSLLDYLGKIEEAVGAFASGQVTIRLKEDTSASTITEGIRALQLTEIDGIPVSQNDDFAKGVGSFPHEDILRFYLADGSRVIVRPSGTEPKVKLYLDTTGDTNDEASMKLRRLESALNELVSSLS